MTDNVYVYLFRYGGHQSIFVVTPDEKWGNDEQFLPGNIERFCEYWGRGY